MLDFGLAKIERDGQCARREATPALTAVHAERPDERRHAIGTVAYMSPEQARGEVARRAHRPLLAAARCSTRWRTGRLPFPGDTSAVDLRRDPEPRAGRRVAQANPALPAELERIVDKALEKDREPALPDARRSSRPT